MGTYRVSVMVADGDDFKRRVGSEMEVLAEDDREALLVAQQMSGTPMMGKPSHMQIVGAQITSVIE